MLVQYLDVAIVQSNFKLGQLDNPPQIPTVHAEAGCQSMISLTS